MKLGDRTAKVIYLALFVVFVIFMMVVFPAFGLFTFKGIESDEYFFKTLFYYGMGMTLFGIVALKVVEIVKKKETTFGIGITHNPELNFFNWIIDEFKAPNLKRFFAWANNPIKLGMLGLAIFIPLGIAGAMLNTFFISAPATEFQIAATGHLIHGTEPASMSETLLFVFITSLEVSFLFWLTKKYKLPMAFFWITALVLLPLTNGLMGAAFHRVRYGAEESSLLSNFLFFSMGTFMTILFMSFILWYLWHAVNNLFFKLNILFADEKILLVTGALYIIAIIIFSIIWIKIKTRKKRGDAL